MMVEITDWTLGMLKAFTEGEPVVTRAGARWIIVRKEFGMKYSIRMLSNRRRFLIGSRKIMRGEQVI